ncbi:MAG TPA: zinc-binding dehydrogenase [Rubricoccaceae bacterium]|nr:zinc-binding dehydrogenase [Rubricoccaceae bacterium]
MRQVWITKAGPPEVLQVREASDPTPGPGEVRIDVEAAGVNFADVLARQGLYPDAPPLPAVVGYEVAGRVAAVGSGVEGLVEGDAVLALTRFGGYGSHVVVPAEAVFRRPAGMTAEAGAALPVTYLTAFQMLVVMGGLRRAEELGGRPMRVLVHAAAGGVGTAAADLGRCYGAELFGTASPHKHDYARSRGYEHVFDSRSDDWIAGVRAATGGQGVDLVLDPIGGAHWGQSFRALAPTGRIVLFGVAEAAGGGRFGLVKMGLRIPWPKFNPIRLINANQGVLGVNLGHLWGMRAEVARWARQLLAYYEQGIIRPHVDRVFPFEEAAEAHRYLESRRSVGKVLLRP